MEDCIFCQVAAGRFNTPFIQEDAGWVAFADVNPQAPIHVHVVPRYLNEMKKEVDVPNVVTAVLASYRGYDTLGETTVVFTAGAGVIALLRRRRKDRLP